MHLFFEAKNGESTVRFRGTLLHSSYNPSREAERFARRAPKARCFLILGGGIGHLARALASAYPDARICTLHPSTELARAAADAPGAHGSPESRWELSALLNGAFGLEGVYGFETLPWEPGATAAPSWFKRIESDVLAIAREWHDSLISTGYFGYRWLKNSVRNLSAQSVTPEPFLLARGKQPVIVAPGPTLEAGIPWLREERPRLLLLAVSSAWATLRSQHLEPDLLLHTDGSYWATLHLRWTGAPGHHSSPPLAASLRSALPASFRGRPALLLTDPSSAVDRALSQAVSLPTLPLPGHGTVSGSALRLLTALEERSPALIGVDLAAYGFRSHARGHAFEPILHGLSSRLATLPTILRGRLGEAEFLLPPWQQPRDLAVYASSLSAELAGRGKPCYRLNPSPVDLSCTAVSTDWSPPLSGAPTGPLTIKPPRGGRKSLGAVLGHWRALTDETTIREIGSTGSGTEARALLEELAQMLALPELLRLRRAMDQEAGGEEAFRELKRRMIERIDQLLRGVEG